MFDIFVSGNCQNKCLRGLSDPFDRWAHTGCGICCLDDVNDDGYISEEDIGQHYEDLCGKNPELMESGYNIPSQSLRERDVRVDSKFSPRVMAKLSMMTIYKCT